MVTYSMVNSPPWRASHQHLSAHLRHDPYCKDSQERCLASILQTNHRYIHLRGPNVMKIVNDTLEIDRTLAGRRITWYSHDVAHSTTNCGEVELDG